MQSRRDFLKTALAFTAATALPLPKGAKAQPTSGGGPAEPKPIEADLPQGWTGSQIKIRQVEMAYSPNGEHVCWHRTRFSALREGDIFRVIEPDGSIADKGQDIEVCWADGDAFPDPVQSPGEEDAWTWGVKVKPCDLSPRPFSSEIREALQVKYNNLFVANPSPYANPEVTYGRA